MKQLWFAGIQDSRLVIEALGSGAGDADGGIAIDSAHEEVGTDDVVLVSRLDYDVLLIDAPPVPLKELPRLISYRLRTEYPGTPDATVFDYLPETEHRSGNRIRVYIMRKEVHAKYAAIAHRGVLMSSDMLLRPTEAAERSGFCLVALPGYAELLEYRGGLLVASRVRELSPSVPAEHGIKQVARHAEAFFRDAGPGEVFSVVGARRETVEELVAALSASTGATALELPDLIRTQSARRAMRREPRLFEPSDRRRRRGSGRIPLLVVGGLLFASILLYAAYVSRTLGGYEGRLSEVRANYLHLQKELAGRTAQMREIAAERRQLEKLMRRRPADVYGFFAAVAHATPGPLRLSDVTLNGAAFTIQGYVPNGSSTAFAFAEDLAATAAFRGVQIVQLVPDPVSGEVQFTITGDYHRG